MTGVQTCALPISFEGDGRRVPVVDFADQREARLYPFPMQDFCRGDEFMDALVPEHSRREDNDRRIFRERNESEPVEVDAGSKDDMRLVCRDKAAVDKDFLVVRIFEEDLRSFQRFSIQPEHDFLKLPAI